MGATGDKRQGEETKKAKDDEQKPQDPTQVLTLYQVHSYTNAIVARGRAEYNEGKILMRSEHPLDECLRRDIIEEEHHEMGKRLWNYRNCAVSKLSGRPYNATGEGDSDMDAATVYANAMRAMNAHATGRRQWQLVSLVCFGEPNIDGRYWSEADYSAIFKSATDLQNALEEVDKAIAGARQALKEKLEKAAQA